MHTYSVVARDPQTGQLGVAVQSHWFSVGSAVPWGEAGVGAVATQSLIEISYGPRGLDLMRKGISAEVALRDLIEQDMGRDFRQVAMIDVMGRVSTYTGKRCIPYAAHRVGKGWSVQANMVVDEEVIASMAEEIARTDDDLADRLVCTLEAAERVGGDIRGQQSAAMLIVEGVQGRTRREGRVVELRVEDHEQPLREIRRLLDLKRVYTHMGSGLEALRTGNLPTTIDELERARRLAGDNIEVNFWNAVALARADRLSEAVPTLREVLAGRPYWRELLSRLPTAGMVGKDVLAELLRLIDDLEESTDL